MLQYSGHARKEIDPVLVSGCCRLAQNYRVFRSAEFGIDHRYTRFLVAILKRQLVS